MRAEVAHIINTGLERDSLSSHLCMHVPVSHRPHRRSTLLLVTIAAAILRHVFCLTAPYIAEVERITVANEWHRLRAVDDCDGRL